MLRPFFLPYFFGFLLPDQMLYPVLLAGVFECVGQAVSRRSSRGDGHRRAGSFGSQLSKYSPVRHSAPAVPGEPRVSPTTLDFLFGYALCCFTLVLLCMWWMNEDMTMDREDVLVFNLRLFFIYFCVWMLHSDKPSEGQTALMRWSCLGFYYNPATAVALQPQPQHKPLIWATWLLAPTTHTQQPSLPPLEDSVLYQSSLCLWGGSNTWEIPSSGPECGWSSSSAYNHFNLLLLLSLWLQCLAMQIATATLVAMMSGSRVRNPIRVYGFSYLPVMQSELKTTWEGK